MWRHPAYPNTLYSLVWGPVKRERPGNYPEPYTLKVGVGVFGFQRVLAQFLRTLVAFVEGVRARLSTLSILPGVFNTLTLGLIARVFRKLRLRV